MSRKVEPEIIIPTDIPVLMPATTVAAGGINIYTIDTGTQEVIRVSLVYEAGVKHQEKAFAASATANLMGEGTAKYSSKEFSETLDFYGIFYDVSIDRDYCVVTFCCLKKFLPQTLDLLKEVMLTPTFPEEELKTYKDKRKQQLKIERQKVDFIARERFATALFGAEHDYGIAYDEALYDNLTTADLRAFFRRHYTAQHCFCVVSGRVDPQEVVQITEMVSAIPSAHENLVYEFSEIKSTPYIYEQREDVLQSAIRVGKVLFNRNHPDFIGMQVVTTLLGGYFGSRLVRNLREDKGYTYGVFATMINLRHSGYLAIATEVAADVTADALAQILIETERLRTEIVSEQELKMVKNVMIGEVMRILDGPFGIADVTIENIQNEKTNAFLTQFISQVNAITPKQVLALAQKYLDKTTFTTVIVGKE